MALFAFFLPFVTTDALFYGPINAKFFYVLFFAIMLTGIFAYQLFIRTRSVSLRGRWFLGALGLLLCTQYVTALLGVFAERSFWSDIFWSSGVLFLTHVVVMAFVLSEMLSPKDWGVARRAVAYSGGLFGFFTILGIQGFGFADRVLFLNFEHSGLTLGNETYAGVYLVLALVMALVELVRREGSRRTQYALFGSVILIGLSPLLFNLGVLLGHAPLASPLSLLGSARASSAAAFVLYGFLVMRALVCRLAPTVWVMRLVAGLGVLLVSGLTVMTSLLFVPGSSVQEAYIAESSAARVIVWGAAWKAVQERPFLGWGPENFNFALERHFDSRLFEEQNLAEIWFDRAHNIFLDTLVGSGLAGLVASLLLIVSFVVVVCRANGKGLIGDTEATLLVALVPLHLLQLQTGFDTVASYTLLALIAGYALTLERGLAGSAHPLTNRLYVRGGAAFLSLLVVLSLGLIVIPEYMRQRALVETFKGGSFETQSALAKQSIARASSFESLRLSSASFLKGSLALLAEKPTADRVERVRAFMRLYDEHYQTYLQMHPDHYRVRMNYAYLLIVMKALGDDRLADAQEILRDSYVLSPRNPLTYILDSITELYQGDLEAADKRMAEALAINADVEFTHAAAAYLERQKKTFPNLSILKLENL